MKPVVMCILLTFFLIALVTCGSDEVTPSKSLNVTSAAYVDGTAIPVKYTCQGEDVSPPYEWSGAPAGTKAWAIIFDDPDAPMRTWVHWILYNLPPETTRLPEGASTGPGLPTGSVQGKNSWGREAYGGPCPPAGKAHRYYFKVYALDAELSLGPGAEKSTLVRAMKGHVLAAGSLHGTYKRR